MRQTAAERETARHRVDLIILNGRGDIAESHRMQSWDVSRTAGEIGGAFRDAHGYMPTLRVRFVGTNADGGYLLPRSWQD